MMKNDFPLVTIVTPSYNQGQYLEETILAVLNQDYPNIEYIIVDGGSSDNSLEILNKYHEKLAWWVSEPDNGQTDALIKGFNKAKGKYLAWVCSDDIIEPSMVSLSVHFLEEYPDAVLTYGNRTRIDSKGNIIGFSRSYINRFFFKFGLGLPQETVMFRKNLYDECEGLNINLKMVMDYDLWCKLYKKGHFFYIPAYLGRFRSHPFNKSTVFSSEMQEVGFKGDFTGEFKLVYERNSGKTFSKWAHKASLFISSLIRSVILKSRKYKKIKREVKSIQNSKIHLIKI